jgi:hypothetical protein
MDKAWVELQELFGESLMTEAAAINPDTVDAREVSEAANGLLRLMGQPERQKELVIGMERSTAAALCRWVYDPTFWRAVGSIKAH